MPRSQLWYTRRGKEIRGPFHGGLIQRYILLGRLRASDEVSSDKEVWTPISQMPDLIPQVMQVDLDDPLARERLMAAKRWADERLHPDRREQGQFANDEMEAERRRTDERRENEQEKEVRYRLNKAQRRPRKTRSGLLNIFGILVAVSLAGVFIGLTVTARLPVNDKGADCGAPPRPGVNWSNCRLEGMQFTSADLHAANLSSADLSAANLEGSHLAGADLSFAKLSIANLRNVNFGRAQMKGVNLINAQLTGADLRHADLSYANLRGADLAGAKLDGAVFDHAIWVNDEVCGPGSTGRCLPASPPTGDDPQ
jgi:uncharacterized protein YjbI with pentapeptide repeats